MNEEDVIAVVLGHIAGQFPKECGCCGKRYETFTDFVRSTTYVGKPLSYDAEEGDWQPARPMGVIGMVNCPCGSTLALSSEGMNVVTLWRLMAWAKKEARQRGITTTDLLEDFRRKIDARVLEESEP